MDKQFCPYCMTPVPAGESCPSCGLTAGNYVPSPHHLPPGTILMDRYLVGRVLGEGGFGITYIGCDLRLELKVAIKEYYPVDRATRNATASLEVTSFIGSAGESFERGRKKFLEEARTMARMDKQQTIVGVRDFFETNNTAYIVMEYIEGTTFADLTVQRGGRIDPEELFRIMEPLFDALGSLHEQGLIHRDISPDNLMLEGGEVRLLDFGCAREAARGTETVTIALKHGYAPLEQYQQKGQGPWTDIYALCATIYLCLTGQAPPQALDRIVEDNLILPSKLGVAISPAREEALVKGLRIQPNRRFQSMEELKAALYAPEAMTSSMRQNLPNSDASQADTRLQTVEQTTDALLEAAPDTALEAVRTEELAGTKKRAAGWTRGKIAAIIGGCAAVLLLAIIVWPKGQRNADTVPADAELEVSGESQSEEETTSTVEAPSDIFSDKALTMTSWDAEAFGNALENENCTSVILHIADETVNLNGYEINKPLYVGENTCVDISHATIGPDGYLEVAGTLEAYWYVRLIGSGEKIHLVEHSGAAEKLNIANALFHIDEDDNLGNIQDGLPYQIAVGSFDHLKDEAIEVRTEQELIQNADADAPLLLTEDINLDNVTDETLLVTTPVLVAENATVRFGTRGIRLDNTVLINEGTIRGPVFAMHYSTLINDGLMDETPDADEGVQIAFENGVVINYGKASINCHSLMQVGSVFMNFGDLKSHALTIQDKLINYGSIQVYHDSDPDAAGITVDTGAGLDNFGTITISGSDHFMINQGYIKNWHGAGRIWIQNEGTLDTRLGILENQEAVQISSDAHILHDKSVIISDFYFNSLGLTTDDEALNSEIFHNILPEIWDTYYNGTKAQIETFEQLQEALADADVETIEITEQVTADSGITIHKPVHIMADGALQMEQGTTLHVNGAFIWDEGEIKVDHLVMENGARIDTDDGSSGRLVLLEHAKMELDHSLIVLRSGIGYSTTSTAQPIIQLQLSNYAGFVQPGLEESNFGEIDVDDTSLFYFGSTEGVIVY